MNNIDIKEYISTKLEIEILKKSNLFKTNPKAYITQLLDLELKLKQFKF